MSCSITYPTAGNYGAVDANGYLVSCCGLWHRPDEWDPLDRCQVWGKVYPPGVAMDTVLPPDAVEGNIWPYDTATGGDFDFNTSLLPNASVGDTNRVKVWLLNVETGATTTDYHDFTGCDYGAAGCPDPDCLGPQPEPERCPCEQAIDRPVPEEYLVGPDLRAVLLIGEALPAWKQAERRADGIRLEYSFSLSTPSRAVWAADGEGHRGPALRLEVARCKCGYTATLYLLQSSQRGIEPARRWRSTQFNLAHGGALRAIDSCCRETDGTIYVSAPDRKRHCEPEKTVV